MEILIPGLILVALMAWASTKIKRAAAAAYEAESIDTGDFSLTKPEGLINPLNNGSAYLFEAYSRDFGDEEHRNERQLSVFVTVQVGHIDKVADEIRSSTAVIDREYPHAGATVVETSDGEGRTICYCIAPSVGKERVYVLKIVALDKHIDDHRSRIRQLLESFRVK